jgi:hypothetical protein
MYLPAAFPIGYPPQSYWYKTVQPVLVPVGFVLELLWSPHWRCFQNPVIATVQVVVVQSLFFHVIVSALVYVFRIVNGESDLREE